MTSQDPDQGTVRECGFCPHEVTFDEERGWLHPWEVDDE